MNGASSQQASSSNPTQQRAFSSSRSSGGSPSFSQSSLSGSRPLPTGFSLPSIYELTGQSVGARSRSNGPSYHHNNGAPRAHSLQSSRAHPFTFYEQQAQVSEDVEMSNYDHSSRSMYHPRGEGSSGSTSSREHPQFDRSIEPSSPSDRSSMIDLDVSNDDSSNPRKVRHRIQLSCTECKKRKVSKGSRSKS